jgi:hypothetical protein
MTNREATQALQLKDEILRAVFAQQADRANLLSRTLFKLTGQVLVRGVFVKV